MFRIAFSKSPTQSASIPEIYLQYLHTPEVYIEITVLVRFDTKNLV